MSGWTECKVELPEANTPVLIEGRDGIRAEGFFTAGGYWNMDGHLEPPGYAIRWKLPVGAGREQGEEI